MEDIPLSPGIHEQILQPRNQRFTLAIPDRYTHQQPKPLIIALHWGGPVTPYIGKWYLRGLVAPALGELGAIIAAPDCTADHWANPNSEQGVLDLFDFLQGTYNIDTKRVLLTGYSMGGIGTWMLAARHQDIFSSALIVSAAPPTNVDTIHWDIPLYVIHSRRDEIFPLLDTKSATIKLREMGAAVELEIVEGNTHFQTEQFVEPMHAAIPWVKESWGM
jgi:predicted peptidase